MTWATGTSETPRLRTYAEAKKWEAQVVPIRRRVPECKPLGRRDCVGLTIRKEGRKIIVRLFGADRVIYHPNDKIDLLVPCGGMGVTDTNLFWSLLGVQGRHFNNCSWLRVSDGETSGWFPMKRKEREQRYAYTDHNGQPAVRIYKTASYSASLVFGTHPYPTYKMLNVKHPTRTAINRDGTREIRKRYREFGKLLSGVTKLERMACEEGSGVYAGNNGVYQTQQKARGISDEEIFAYIKSKDMGQQMQAAQLLAQRHVVVDYRYNYRTQQSTTTRTLDQNKVIASFYKVIYAAHKKEAYKTEVVTDGKLVKNRHSV